MITKTQTFPTQTDALSHFNVAVALAQAECDRRNTDDPDLHEAVLTSTNIPAKKYIMVRPDQMEGIIAVEFCWE